MATMLKNTEQLDCFLLSWAGAVRWRLRRRAVRDTESQGRRVRVQNQSFRPGRRRPTHGDRSLPPPLPSLPVRERGPTMRSVVMYRLSVGALSFDPPTGSSHLLSPEYSNVSHQLAT